MIDKSTKIKIVIPPKTLLFSFISKFIKEQLYKKIYIEIIEKISLIKLVTI